MRLPYVYLLWASALGLTLAGARNATGGRRTSIAAGASATQSQLARDSMLGDLRVTLGSRLFADPILSRDSTVSCATCHMPEYAFAEPRPVSHGLGHRARKRNAPSLLTAHLFRVDFDWDGRASDLTSQLHGVFSRGGDMDLDLASAVARVTQSPAYQRAFVAAYGRQPDVASILDAIVQFELSLDPGSSRFERYYLESAAKALTPMERRGWEFFRSSRSGCAGCHAPLPDPNGSPYIVFSDGRFHNLGVGYDRGTMSDVGRYAVTRQPTDWGKFRTPSLRNVALTAPYMHDGSLATLEDVIAFYEKGGIRNPGLDVIMVPRRFSRAERAQLVAFLRSLSAVDMGTSGTVNLRSARVPVDGLSLKGR